MNTLAPHNMKMIYAPFMRVLEKGVEWEATYKSGRRELNEGQKPSTHNEFWHPIVTLQNPGNKVGLQLSRAKPSSHPNR